MPCLSPLDPAKEYKDWRATTQRPVDVVTTDKPAADTAHFLRAGNDSAASWTKDKWKPGQLIGKDGSDPATIAQSPSMSSTHHFGDPVEPRSVTSTGHVLHRPRPIGVPLGWGDYDQFTSWQTYGRRVKGEMLTDLNTKWELKRTGNIEYTSEAGEDLPIVKPVIEEKSLPYRKDDPLTMDQLVSKPKDSKAKYKRTPGRFAGTSGKDD